jgi:hypothetical protein
MLTGASWRRSRIGDVNDQGHVKVARLFIHGISAFSVVDSSPPAPWPARRKQLLMDDLQQGLRRPFPTHGAAQRELRAVHFRTSCGIAQNLFQSVSNLGSVVLDQC